MKIFNFFFCSNQHLDLNSWILETLDYLIPLPPTKPLHFPIIVASFL
ncbi:hypothetical protein SLEP1_g14493 [Rubroshorea leprosula]|uniref:Uncharacterized protein n=1 Tax=Rubroshorea leprosula TaxID=152421 RepID=A0AAV5IS52_9ROSI|nr:hypothetical protein SLEP1_g14493 [Rubroshorea leprosula]